MNRNTLAYKDNLLKRRMWIIKRKVENHKVINNKMIIINMHINMHASTRINNAHLNTLRCKMKLITY